MSACYLAIDIGASSGRHILSRLEGGKITLEEIHRFTNRQIRADGHNCWDIGHLWNGILEGLKICGRLGKIPRSVGIDTWGVDYVLLDGGDSLLGGAVSYHDRRTDGFDRVVEALVSPEELYRRTGIQKLGFNTIYQLMAFMAECPEKLRAAESFLMIPDYFNFLLTGRKLQEYTNATTTGLVDAAGKEWDMDLIRRLGLPPRLFGPLSMPGTVVGEFTPEIREKVGFSSTVILPASHDTASAYLAVPASDKETVCLSSGTWSLLGVENDSPVTTEASRVSNFTNEGGAFDRFLYLKNIMGLWMIQSIRRELNGDSYVEGRVSRYAGSRKWSFPDLIAEAEKSRDFVSCVDVDDGRFLSPESMIDEIRAACRDSGQEVPETVGQIVQCVYLSISECYRKVIGSLGPLTGKRFTGINIVGGGCQDSYLNAMTARAAGLPVYAGPVEGTAIGNIIVQMIAAGEFPDLAAAREAVLRSFDVREFR